MSKFFLFSHINKQKPQINTKTPWYHKFNYFHLNVGCLLLIGVLFVSYIWVANDTANAGFNMDKLQSKLDTIAEQNRQLEVSVQQLQSMDHIKKLSENYSLEPINDAQYITANDSVALNK